MILEIDAGNTRIKWRLRKQAPFASQAILWSQINQLERFLVREEGIESIWVSCVASEERELLLRKVLSAFASNVDVVWVESAEQMAKVRFAYKDVSKLGVDRCLAMCAAYENLGRDLLVIDAGSAITADYLDKSGQHLGGYIFPGLSMLRESLRSGTGRVAVREEELLETSPGQDTEDCVTNAVNLALRATVMEWVSKVCGDLSHATIITGGDAEFICRITGMSFQHVPDLVLDGLVSAIRGMERCAD